MLRDSILSERLDIVWALRKYLKGAALHDVDYYPAVLLNEPDNICRVRQFSGHIEKNWYFANWDEVLQKYPLQVILIPVLRFCLDQRG